MRDGKSRGLQRARRRIAARDRKRSLQNKGRFVKLQAGIAWVELAVVSIPEIAQRVDFPFLVRKKFRIDFVSSETGHRSAIQPQSARRENEVCGLQRTIAERGLVNQWFVPDKVGAHVSMWK